MLGIVVLELKNAEQRVGTVRHVLGDGSGRPEEEACLALVYNRARPQEHVGDGSAEQTCSASDVKCMGAT